ncbi:MAG: putative manganese-dependent inorganic diphosphatase [Eubacterium sp.]|nr:putative manganese-dependent inorganic diphosphatase [Eubacterium sp.]
MSKEIYIFGHKSPDTDSICSAICLAYLRNRMVEENKEDEFKHWGKVDSEATYVAKAAGEPNSETAYVLNRFGVDAPEVLLDIRKQVKDINFRYVPPVSEEISLKEAWTKMNEEKAYTVPIITEGDKMKGIITIGDIAREYMNVEDSVSVGIAKTSYKNIIEVLEGEMLIGDETAVVDGGRIRIAAANPLLVERYAEPGDVVVLSDDDENQKLLINKGVRCVIICNDVEIRPEVLELAEEKGVAIIKTAHDSYTCARLMNQSIPARHFMRPADEVCVFEYDEFIDDIREVIAEKRHRNFPVVDNDGNYRGMLDKSSLIDMSSKKVILVDHNEMNQAVFGLFDAEVVEVVDHHKLGTVETMNPISLINKPVGSTATIVYQLFVEAGIEIPYDIAGLLCSAILSDTMLFKSPTCTSADGDAAKAMAEKHNIDLANLWEEMLRASLDLDSKTEKEIFYQDYKHFTAEGFTFGAGQVLAANEDDVQLVKDRMVPYLETALAGEGIDLVCLMITNVTDESTDLIFTGSNAKAFIESAFGKKTDGNCIHLEGVVSRKKQLIPPMMAVLNK